MLIVKVKICGLTNYKDAKAAFMKRLSELYAIPGSPVAKVNHNHMTITEGDDHTWFRAVSTAEQARQFAGVHIDLLDFDAYTPPPDIVEFLQTRLQP